MKIGLRDASALLLATVSLAILSALIVPTASAATVSSGPVSAVAAGDPGDGQDYGRMMLLLDSSGSMAEPAGGGETKIAAAKSALRRVISGLPDQAQVGLRVFGAKVFSRKDKGACTDSQLVVPPDTGNRSQLAAAVQGYKPYGETPIPYALQQAAQDLGDEGARSIVLVSDGESTCDPNPCKVAADLSKGGIDLQIDVVGLSVSGSARNQLQCIADAGNGHYYDADSAGEIESRLTRVAERAVRPFSLSGQPIQGGPESRPTPVTAGDWIDTLGSADSTKSYVFTRETPGTTIRASAITQGERTSSDGVKVEIFGPDGTRCDYGTIVRTLDIRDLIGAEAAAGPESPDSTTGPCAEPGDYRITVTRGMTTEKKVPFGLRVTEEPPVEELGFTDSSADTTVTPPQVSGPQRQVEGGSSFENATEIAPGRWSSTIVPGEALLFRFPLDFGQAARVRVTFPAPSAGLRDLYGDFPPLAQMSLFNPMRAQLAFPSGATFSDGVDGAKLVSATPAVSRSLLGATGGANSGSFNGSKDYSTSGSYYLMVSVKREDYTPEIPFTIDLETVGQPAEGPTYAGGATWTVADGVTGDAASGSPTSSGSASPSEDASSTPAASGSDAGSSDGGGSSAVAVTGGVVGVAGVLAIAAALLLWRRRQAGA